MPNADEKIIVHIGRVIAPSARQAVMTSQKGEVVERNMESVLALEERLRQIDTCFLYERDGVAVWPEMTMTCAKRLGPEHEGDRRSPKTVEMIKSLRKFSMQTTPTVMLGLADARNAIVSLVYGDDAAPGQCAIKVDIQGQIQQVPITWGPGFVKVPLFSMRAYLSAYDLMEHARAGVIGIRDPHPAVELKQDLLVPTEEPTPMGVGVDLV